MATRTPYCFHLKFQSTPQNLPFWGPYVHDRAPHTSPAHCSTSNHIRRSVSNTRPNRVKVFIPQPVYPPFL